MATSVQPETTPAHNNAASLDTAQQRFLGLLSQEEQQPANPPEQPPKAEGSPPPAAASATEQAPAAPTAGSEQAPSESQESTSEPDAPVTYPVKFAGKEEQVTLEELTKGYSRTQDYTLKTQKLAEDKRQFDAEATQVRAERHQYQTTLETLKQAIQTQQPAEPNWEQRRLQVTPEQLAQEMMTFRETQKRIDQITAEQQRVAGLQRVDAERQFATRLEDERQKLNAALPDFADPTSGPQIRQSLYEYAKGLGFADDDIGPATTDHRVVVLIHKAMQFDKAQAAKPKIESKIENALKPAAPGNRQPAKPLNKLAEAKSRLKDTGRVEDAAAAFYQLLD